MITCLYDLSINGTTLSGVQVTYQESTISGVYNHSVTQTLGPPYIDPDKVYDALELAGYLVPNEEYVV